MATMEIKELVEAVDQCRSGYVEFRSFMLGFLFALLMSLTVGWALAKKGGKRDG